MKSHPELAVSVHGSSGLAVAPMETSTRWSAPQRTVPSSKRSPAPVEVEVTPAKRVPPLLPHERALPTGYHRCPTLPGEGQPLVQRTIDATTCASLQCESYHKCGSCIHAQQPQYAGDDLPPVDNNPSQMARARDADEKRKPGK